MCSTRNLIPRKHWARCRTGTRDPALSPPWSCAALSISASCEALQRSSVPCSSPSPVLCSAGHHGPTRCRPQPALLSAIACAVPIRAALHKAPPARHPPLLPCAAPTHAGSAPAALRSARHPCGLPSAQHCASLPCTQILPHHGIAFAFTLHPEAKPHRADFGEAGQDTPSNTPSFLQGTSLHMLFGASICPCPVL